MYPHPSALLFLLLVVDLPLMLYVSSLPLYCVLIYDQATADREIYRRPAQPLRAVG